MSVASIVYDVPDESVGHLDLVLEVRLDEIRPAFRRCDILLLSWSVL
jgi:hypothetical protein